MDGEVFVWTGEGQMASHSRFDFHFSFIPSHFVADHWNQLSSPLFFKSHVLVSFQFIPFSLFSLAKSPTTPFHHVSHCQNHVAWSGGWTEDLRLTVEHIRQLLPYACLVGAGFSLGANVFVKYAAEEGIYCKINGIVSVSNPYDLQLCTTYLPTIYDSIFVQEAKKLLHRCE